MDRAIIRFKAFSDKTRVRIIRLLLSAGRELCICEVMDSLKIPQSNISKHVRELKIAGFLKERKAGRFVFYSIAKQNELPAQAMLKVIELLKDAAISEDEKRLRKRLSLREGGKCVVGMRVIKRSALGR